MIPWIHAVWLILGTQVGGLRGKEAICQRQTLDNGLIGEWSMSIGWSVFQTHLSNIYCILILIITLLLIQPNFMIAKADSRGFKFEAWWTLEPSFEEEIRKVWGTIRDNIFSKLDCLRAKLRMWERQKRRDRVGLKEELTRKLKVLLKADQDEENLVEIVDTKIHLNWEIDKEELFLVQRSRVNWLQCGDKNISFFHKFASQRRSMTSIKVLEGADGRTVTEHGGMMQIAISYSKDLFTSSHEFTDMSYILSGVDRSISDDDNFELNVIFTNEDIFVALKEMRPIKAPSIDDFPTIYIKSISKSWERRSVVSVLKS